MVITEYFLGGVVWENEIKKLHTVQWNLHRHTRTFLHTLLKQPIFQLFVTSECFLPEAFLAPFTEQVHTHTR